MVDNGFVGVACSPARSCNRYVVALQAKCLFLLLKAFYFPMFTVLSSRLTKLPPFFILFNVCIHLVTEDSTSTSVPDDVQSQPTLGRWEDRHVRRCKKTARKFCEGNRSRPFGQLAIHSTPRNFRSPARKFWLNGLRP